MELRLRQTSKVRITEPSLLSLFNFEGPEKGLQEMKEIETAERSLSVQ